MTAPLRDAQWAALEILRHVAVPQRGWRYRGVRGWILAPEVNAEARRPLSAVLGTLVADGLAFRVDVRGPGQEQPLWLYRIREAGLHRVEMRTGARRRALREGHDDPVDRGVFFMARDRWDALAALQAACPEGVPLAETAVPGGTVPYETARWLIRTGLAQRHAGSDAIRPRTFRYRASELGMRVRTAAPPTATWAQLRLHDNAR